MTTFIDINLQDYGVVGMRRGVRRASIASHATPATKPSGTAPKPPRPAIRTPRRKAHKSITQPRLF